MIRISQLLRTVLPVEKARMTQVQDIFRVNFSAVAEYADKIPDMLNNPIKYGYTSVLLISETSDYKITGFSLILYFAGIRSGLLDFLAVSPEIHGSGTGGALYEASREYLKQIGATALYMEALPDDPKAVKNADMLKENKRRLKFYEGYGVRPIIGTEYETPTSTEWPAPYLLYDALDTGKPLKRSHCRAAIRTILSKKYSHLVGPEYIEHVVESVIDEPVKIREPKYIKKPLEAVNNQKGRLAKNFIMVCTNAHEVHHVHERGYVERPARVKAIEASLKTTGLFDSVESKHFSQSNILSVHNRDFVSYLKAVCGKLESKRPVYPYVFPIRRPDRKPKDLAVRAGYYCIDTFTPLDKNAYNAACTAVDVALTAAGQLLKGKPVAYALCRPPGHHAETKTFGGFCYFNNAAIAANMLSKQGTVATLDIDFHHGNGTQTIFYERSDVLNVSIHGHPNTAYPYFSGFADETGSGQGLRYNLNLPLEENVGELVYLKTLTKALNRIEEFAPTFLVVSLGFDIMKGDPTGSFALTSESMRKIGTAIGYMNMPTLVVQEGGYNLQNLKTGAIAFFSGLAKSMIEFQEREKRTNGRKK